MLITTTLITLFHLAPTSKTPQVSISLTTLQTGHTLQLPMISPPHQPRWKTHKADWRLFQDSIETWASVYTTAGKDLNQPEAKITMPITDAANSAIPLSKPTVRLHSTTMTVLLSFTIESISPRKNVQVFLGQQSKPVQGHLRINQKRTMEHKDAELVHLL